MYFSPTGKEYQRAEEKIEDYKQKLEGIERLLIHRFFGIILIIDAITSLILPQDKQFLWQVGRVIRGMIGLWLILEG